MRIWEPLMREVWKEHWQLYHPGQLDVIHILVNASMRLLIARWTLIAPRCPTHLQNLAQLVEDHWRNRYRLRCLFLSGARTFSATLAHPERLSPRRAAHGGGRLSINSTNNGCHLRAAAFCWHTHSKAGERRPRWRWKPSHTQPLSTLKRTAKPIPNSSVFSELDDRRGWAHSAGGVPKLPSLPSVVLPSFE